MGMNDMLRKMAVLLERRQDALFSYDVGQQKKYIANAMILVEKRNTESLAEGMKTALEKNWNKEEIRNYSRNFSIENMATLYLESYKEKLIGGGYAEKNELGDFLWCCKKLNKQILFCVGNISENKNQIALIEALYKNQNNDLIAIILKQWRSSM